MLYAYMVFLMFLRSFYKPLLNYFPFKYESNYIWHFKFSTGVPTTKWQPLGDFHCNLLFDPFLRRPVSLISNNMVFNIL